MKSNHDPASDPERSGIVLKIAELAGKSRSLEVSREVESGAYAGAEVNLADLESTLRQVVRNAMDAYREAPNSTAGKALDHIAADLEWALDAANQLGRAISRMEREREEAAMLAAQRDSWLQDIASDTLRPPALREQVYRTGSYDAVAHLVAADPHSDWGHVVKICLERSADLALRLMMHPARPAQAASELWGRVLAGVTEESPRRMHSLLSIGALPAEAGVGPSHWRAMLERLIEAEPGVACNLIQSGELGRKMELQESDWERAFHNVALKNAKHAAGIVERGALPYGCQITPQAWATIFRFYASRSNHFRALGLIERHPPPDGVNLAPAEISGLLALPDLSIQERVGLMALAARTPAAKIAPHHSNALPSSPRSVQQPRLSSVGRPRR